MLKVMELLKFQLWIEIQTPTLNSSENLNRALKFPEPQFIC